MENILRAEKKSVVSKINAGAGDSLAVDDVIIDVRHPSEGEQSPLKLTNNEILQIPFYELNQQLPELPANRQYLLYCDRGTMSRMHAGHLKAEGHANVKVYVPAA